MTDEEFFKEAGKRKVICVSEELLKAVYDDGRDTIKARILELIERKRKDYTVIGFTEKADTLETLQHLIKGMKNE